FYLRQHAADIRLVRGWSPDALLRTQCVSSDREYVVRPGVVGRGCRGQPNVQNALRYSGSGGTGMPGRIGRSGTFGWLRAEKLQRWVSLVCAAIILHTFAAACEYP